MTEGATLGSRWERAAGPQAVAVCVLVLLTTGCTGAPRTETRSPTSIPVPDRSASATPIPTPDSSTTSSGSWAADFAQLRADATTDLQRAVLADDRITDQELTEVNGAYAKCLEAAGFSDVAFPPGGGMSFDAPPKTSNETHERVTTECDDTVDGGIRPLFWDMKRNPEHIDEATLMVSCLVRSKIVPRSYTAKDYERDFAASSEKYDTDSQKFHACVADPLHAGS